MYKSCFLTKDTKHFNMNIVTLPREIQLLLSGQLSVVNLGRLSETCHRLKEVARDPSLWKKLTLTYERIKNKNEACRKHASRCSGVREIVITGTGEERRSDKIMTVLVKATNSLTSITLSPSLAGLSNASFVKIGEMTQLTHLALGGGNPGPGGISALARLTELRTLKVPGIVCGDSTGCVDAPCTNIPTAVLVDLFSKLKKLEQVEMVEMKFISDEIVESLVNNNPNLHHLDITLSGFRRDSEIEEISSRSLILIADKCPQLTYIGIGYHIGIENPSETSITKIVENCPKLKHANFERTEFSDTSLAMMSNNCPDLEYHAAIRPVSGNLFLELWQPS